MTRQNLPIATPVHSRQSTWGVAALAIALLTGCGGGKGKSGSQTAAKVNKEEITVHQINYVLQQQRGVPQEQVEAASREILERLIDQELAVQRADELELDREPRVLQQLEAARREILARAYAEKVGAAARRPEPEEIRKYYEEHPALFAGRRIYRLQEISIEATPDQVNALRARLGELRSIDALIEYLRAAPLRYSGAPAVRAAEQLPLASLDAFASMRDGQAILNATPTGAQLVVLVGSEAAPITEAQARPAIEQFLLGERRRRLVDDDRRGLRAMATIRYVGQFAASAPRDGEAPTPPSAPASALMDPAVVKRGMGGK
jgi:EpsD family peptidyl-prolyl cis-trans isomerase